MASCGRSTARPPRPTNGLYSKGPDDRNHKTLLRNGNDWRHRRETVSATYVASVPVAVAATRALCVLGPARTAEESGLKPDIVATEYTIEGLVNALSSCPAKAG